MQVKSGRNASNGRKHCFHWAETMLPLDGTNIKAVLIDANVLQHDARVEEIDSDRLFSR